MELLAAYADDDDGDVVASASASATVVPRKVTTAPAVTLTAMQRQRHQLQLALGGGGACADAGAGAPLDPNARVVLHNPKASQLYAPVYGPAAPGGGDAAARRNHRSGHLERNYVSPAAFDEQYAAFLGRGSAAAPDGGGTVRNIAGVMTNSVTAQERHAADADALPPSTADAEEADGASREERRQRQNERRERKRAEQRQNEGASFANAVAAAFAARQVVTAWTAVEDDRMRKPERTKEALEYNAWLEARRIERGKHRKVAEGDEGDAGAAEDGDGDGDGEGEGEGEGGRGERSFFHGKAETNYAGESWLAAPKDKKSKINPLEANCYIPKKWEFSWSGHSKGVGAARVFPRSGHLILSAGLDSKVKIWDMYGSGKCMRTYLGHAQAVKDVQFSNDGTRFLSASFDRMIKLWDTETGKVIGRFSTDKVPNCVRFHPDADKQNVMLAGMSDKKIVQFDMDSGNLEQEYNEHLGAVNSITFVDQNRRFVTSSDDKTLRVWEYGTPVQIKYIADPAMHSMPSVAAHPGGAWIACQSLDNQVVVYSTRERFRKNHKKSFKGHTNSGYACQLGFSPDGRYLMSGDANGRMFFWDWKSGKVYRTFKAHDGVCIGCEWHPLEQSKVITCGWDGLIKLWD